MSALITNTNTKTGLPFGVISGNSLDPDILNDIIFSADIVVYERELDEFKVNLAETISPNSEEYELAVERFNDQFSCEEPSADICIQDITLHLTWLGGAPLVFSFDGPTQKVAAYCSPCVPGAADLDSGAGDIECHGIPADWLYVENADA